MKLREFLARWARRALIIPPVLIGVVVLAVVVAQRRQPVREVVPEAARPLRVIQVPETAVVPRVLGYGTAQPGDVWSAVAEVRGRIVETHPELKSGAIVRKGDVVLRIDRTEYELRQAQIQAEIAQLQAEQEELEARRLDLQTSLQIEQQSLEAAERDLARLRELRTSNAVAEASYDESLRKVLTQRQSVQGLQTQLNVLPAQRQALEAGLQAKQAALKLAELDLDRTVVTAPFDCRISQVALEEGQFVSAGQVLFAAYGAATTEVEAQVPIDRLRTLLPPTDAAVDLSRDAMQTMRTIFDVQAIVRMRSGDFVVEWQARFDRMREELDLQTRTMPVVVVVDRPYEGVVPGKRPPLAPGMFCEVELRARPRENQIVVPRTSVWDGSVFLVDDQNRLVRRPVQIAFSQGSISVVAQGLAAGETLVVSDPTPAVEGMLVEPDFDAGVADRLVAAALGQGDLQ
jgi:RND family efflux transporter MFP subunit